MCCQVPEAMSSLPRFRACGLPSASCTRQGRCAARWLGIRRYRLKLAPWAALRPVTLH